MRTNTVPSSWPSPAEEALLDNLSFDSWLLQADSFMVTSSGDAMQDAGIHKGDIVIVQRGRQPLIGDIVLASIDSQWLLRYYQLEHNKPVLYPANGLYEPTEPKESMTLIGVVTAVIRKYH